jgi:putative ABC transport system permease protein
MWRRQGRLIAAATRQARRYPLRSLLVAGCAAMGVAGAITAVNYASGGREQVLGQIQKLGTNVVNVTAQQSRSVAGRARTGALVTTLQPADYQALRRGIPDIVRASAVASTSLRLKGNGQSKVAGVVGVEPDYFLIRDWALASGTGFDAADQRRSARVALLGAALARDLYGDQSPVGERLFINRIPFEIVGVLRERGPGLDAVNEDQQVFVPLATAMRWCWRSATGPSWTARRATSATCCASGIASGPGRRKTSRSRTRRPWSTRNCRPRRSSGSSSAGSG